MRIGILTLNIDTPFVRVEAEGFKGATLAEALSLVDELIATIVTSSGIPL